METVPKQEIEGGISKFQSSLEEMDLNGAFFLQNTDLFYFSGAIQSSVLFVPRQGEPILMVPKGFQRVRQESPIKHARPLATKGQTKEMLEDFGFGGPKKMGLEMHVLPANLYFWDQQTFPEYDWSDISSAIQKLRMIKTPYEVEQIKSAARILHKGYLEIREIFREGMTELEIDGHLALVATVI